MLRRQQTFNPVDYGFEWTSDGWYSWDRTSGHKAARRERDRMVRELRKQGCVVRCFSLPSQLISRGGIGSGRPHIEQVVTVYGFDIEHGC